MVPVNVPDALGVKDPETVAALVVILYTDALICVDAVPAELY
jgi:hypothetical protein